MAGAKRKAGGGDDEGGRSKKRVAVDGNMDNRRITRGLATNMARNVVLDTTELLEGVLVCLPFKNLSVIQRVSRRFRDVIAGSIRLQEKMWLRPYSSSFKRESWTLRTRNLDDLEMLRTAEGLPNMIGQPVVLADITPLAEPAYLRTIFERLYFAESKISLDITGLPGATGSWRKLLITDPPCNEVGIDTSIRLEDPQSSNSGRPYQLSATLRNENGVNIGDLHDALFLPSKSMASHPTLQVVTRSPSKGAAGILTSNSRQGRVASLVIDVRVKDMLIATAEERSEVMAKGKAVTERE